MEFWDGDALANCVWSCNSCRKKRCVFVWLIQIRKWHRFLITLASEYGKELLYLSLPIYLWGKNNWLCLLKVLATECGRRLKIWTYIPYTSYNMFFQMIKYTGDCNTTATEGVCMIMICTSKNHEALRLSMIIWIQVLSTTHPKTAL